MKIGIIPSLFNYLMKIRNVNCCSGVHLKKTGEVRPIKILRQNYRENKKELEFVFELTNDLNSIFFFSNVL